MKKLTLTVAIGAFLFASCTNDGAENPANSAPSPEGTGPDRIHYQEQLTPGTYYGDTTIGNTGSTNNMTGDTTATPAR